MVSDVPEMACFTVSEILHCLLTYSFLSLSTLYVTGTGSGLLVSNSLIDEEKGERMVVLGGA